MNLKSLALSLAALAAAAALHAQIRTPQPSPAAKVEQRVGLTDVVISYSRPSAKDRAVFGDLVPYDKMWRTGANAATRISFSDNVKLEGKDVPKGEYALYTIPGKKEWTVTLYKDLSLGGNVAGYDQSKELVRFQAPAGKSGMRSESFTVEVNDLRDDHAFIYLKWDETYVRMRLDVEVDTRVMADIDRVMAGPSGGDYYSAASYYYSTNRDLGKALEWINIAVERNPNAYWIATLKAEIQGKMGSYSDAVKTAEAAAAVARNSNDDSYVRRNENNIATWKKSMK
ncbi:MAG: DUF2911 domain-containing protein [Bacteroidia bacterium]|nr:DUF2911 domain-containing protein [Bacteroidia bacterium]